MSNTTTHLPHKMPDGTTRMVSLEELYEVFRTQPTELFDLPSHLVVSGEFPKVD